ncbi:MAG: PAS domain S-box protein [Deltaproteobacteria bacterium]
MKKAEKQAEKASPAARPKHPLKSGVGKTLGKPAGDATEKSTILLDQTFEQSPIPMVLVSMPGAVVQIVNSAYRTLVGIADEPSRIGTSLIDAKFSFQYYSPDGKPVHADQLPLMKALSSKKTVHEEYRIVRKDGTQRRVMLNAAPIFNDRGDIIAGCLVMSDITDQKQAEEKMRESEERYRSLFENANEAIFVAQDDKLVFFNPKTLQLSGCSKEEMASTPFIEFIHPDDRDLIMDRYSRRIRGEGVPSRYTFRLIHKSGETRWVEISSIVITWQGKPASLNFLSDITLRMLTEEKLQASEERFRAIFNASFQFTGLLTTEGILIEANRAALDFAGITAEEIISRPFWEARWWRGNDARVQQLKEAIGRAAKGEFVRYEVELQGAGSTTMLIDFSLKPVFDFRGSVTLLVPEGRDISDRKRFEENLQKERDLLYAITEASPVGITFVDRRGQILFANRQAENILGLSRDEITQQTYNAPVWRITDDNGQPFPEAELPFRRVMATGKPVYHVQHAIVWPDGRRVLLSVNAAPLLDAEGRVDGMVAALEDITERKRIENALRVSEEQYRALIESSPDIIMRFDEEGRHLFVSENVKDVAGIPAARFIGRTHRELGFAEPLCSFFEKSIQQVFQSGAPFETEFTFDSSHGAIVFNWRLIPELATEWNVRSVMSICRNITAHRHAELEYKTLFNEMLDGFSLHEIICDDQGRPVDYRFLAVNPSFERMTGLKAVNIVGRTVRDIMPGTEQYWIDRFGKVALTGEPAYFENYAGEIGKYFEVKAYRPAQNQFACIFADITDRKLATEQLNQSHDLLAKLASLVPGVIYQYRLYPDGRSTFPYSSPGMHTIYEFSPEDVQEDATPVFGRLHPDDSDHVSNAIRESARTLQTFYCEFRVILPRQGLRWRWSQAHPERMADGGTLWHGIISDITERKLAWAAIRESEEKFSTAFEKAPILMIITSIEDGRIMDINDAVTKLTGFTREEAIGRKTHEMGWITPEERTHLVQELEETGSTEGREIEAQDRNGNKINCLVFRKVITIGGHKRMLTLAHDITDRKQAEAARLKLEDQLQQAQKMESVGRLAGGVAHDFNNMLGVILGRTQMALDRIDPSHPLHDDLAEIQKAAERSADITRQLLAFARRQTVTPILLDLNKTVSDMKKMLQRLIGENINLIWIPGRDLWPVRMDPGQIDQILANLCVNARDAIEGVGRVALETQNIVIDEASCAGQADFSPGDYVLLTVCDDGCGISPELNAHLFEPFFTTKEIGKGTGLGLATVYGIVRQNRGFITVESTPGQGTTFKIYLPRDMAGKDHVTAKTPERPEAQGHETILLVEDEPAILELTTIMLEGLGYAVLPAGRPGEAIRLAREHAGTIHLLITDVVMPEMNGRDLAKNLLSVYPDIKRLFMSGYTADVIAHQGVLDEGVHFIQKPFHKNELASKVREALDR